jgi:cell division protein FtsZ
MLNIDLKDAKTVLGNSGKAIMGKATASGEDRARKAICAALDSPLLNDNRITGCKNVLLLIISGEEEITIDEMGEINDYIQYEAGGNANIIMGMGEDPSLGSEISVTVIATGFTGEQAKDEGSEKKVIHVLNDKDVKEVEPVVEMPETPNDESVEQKNEPDLFSWSSEEKAEAEIQPNPQKIEDPIDESDSDQKVVHVLDMEEEEDNAEEDGFSFATDDEESSREISATEKEEFSDENKYVKPSTFNFLETANTSREEQSESPDVEAAVEEEIQANEDQTIRHTLSLDEDEDDSKGDLESYIFSNENDDDFGFELITKDETPDDSIPERNEKEVDNSSQQQSYEPTSESQGLDSAESTEAPISEKRTTREDERKRAMEDSYEDSVEASRRRADERRARLNQFNHKFSKTTKGIERLENEPAYKRKGVELNETPHSSDQPKSQFTLTDDEEGPSIKTKNSFLHDNVD